MFRKIKKENIVKIVEKLMKDYDVVAPVRNEKRFVFEKIKNPEKIVLDYDSTILPPKKFLLPSPEIMIRFDNDKITIPENNKKTIFFGIHPCDMNAINLLDKVEYDEYKDDYYIKKRENSVFVCVDCTKANEYCFCESMGSDKPEGYDVLLTDIGDYYFVETGSRKGEELVENGFFENVDKNEKIERKKNCKRKMNIENFDKILKQKFDDKIWEQLGDKCLGCGSCSFVCPTCYCYSVKDIVDLSLKKGERRRVWDSCLLVDFAKVAGGHNFREKRSARVKQRMYHKELYFFEKYNYSACVGCGRCIRECPVGIDVTDVISKIRGD
ncbi:MAG: 4Fe-4S dicluster domain-containing protein [Thermoplasmatales archaeon]|nr:4Fe-4S dicluster domain-containing protein [Thermoplasmatales archaeon]